MFLAFHFAQRARCAAAILLRPAADIVRFLADLPTTDRLPLSLRSTEIASSSCLTRPSI